MFGIGYAADGKITYLRLATPEEYAKFHATEAAREQAETAGMTHEEKSEYLYKKLEEAGLQLMERMGKKKKRKQHRQSKNSRKK